MQNSPFLKKLFDSTLKAILKYRNFPGILAIGGELKNNLVFTFCNITLEEILKKIGKLDISKSSQDKHVPAKHVIENFNRFAPFICESFNNLIDSSIFPAVLLKKVPNIRKKTMDYVSCLMFSKIYERCMHKQITNYFGIFFSKFQCVLRRRFIL